MKLSDSDKISPAHLLAIRKDGLSFLQCVETCLDCLEMVAQFDRLRGTNLLGKGLPTELAIDKATGRQTDDMEKFLRFVWNCVFINLPIKPK